MSKHKVHKVRAAQGGRQYDLGVRRRSDQVHESAYVVGIPVRRDDELIAVGSTPIEDRYAKPIGVRDPGSRKLSTVAQCPSPR